MSDGGLGGKGGEDQGSGEQREGRAPARGFLHGLVHSLGHILLLFDRALPLRLLSSRMLGRRGGRLAGAIVIALACTTGGEAADAWASAFPAVLRVLVSADEMPEVFSFAAQAPKPGFERELVEGFAKVRKLEVRIVPVKNFDQIIPMLVKGEGDLIVGIVDTAARRQKIAFTSETYPVRHLAVTRQPQARVTTLADLRGMKVAVIPGTTWADMAAEAGVPAANQVSCTTRTTSSTLSRRAAPRPR